MTKALGETFGRDMADAGIAGLPISWGATDDTFKGRESLTPEQNTTLDQVIAAHDPAAKLPLSPAPNNVVLFEHENRLRALEGASPVTLETFVARIPFPKRPRGP